MNYLNEKYDNTQWGRGFRTLLYDAMEIDDNGHIEKQNAQRDQIVQRLQKLLERPPEKKHKELHTFYKRMRRERQNLFTFLFIKDVPPDNNASERAIRNVKVKQKTCLPARAGIGTVQKRKGQHGTLPRSDPLSILPLKMV
ncbi:hypothetical protein MNBD_BACTEROID03-1466 [hydrothermal vent metagenome]|uniref:Transposase IS66 central domain-containing protein n=1 Tax=hydrothermal vent metagenome TaxID=652676 RepID=A0A3B0TGN2_9ZZZZ